MGDKLKGTTDNLVAPGIINYASVLRIPVKLDSNNWNSWSLFVQKGLASLDKEGHLTEKPPVPVTREWRIDDSGIQMALWNAMEPQVLSIAQNFLTVKEMWDHLSSSFSAKESLSHAYSVVQAYTRAEQGDLSFTDYFTRFSKFRDELRALFPPTTDLKVQEERNTKMDVMMFIAGLSPKYANARPLLLSNSNAISSVASTYHLLREMYGSDAPPTDISAMHTSTGILYSDQGHCRVGAFTEGEDGRIFGFSDADWAGCPFSRRSTTGYCVFVGGNLVSWKSKKQHTVSRSSAESEYRAMADVTSEMTWVRRLLKELGFVSNDLMRLYCDNQSAIHIAKNQVFHERTKHIEVDCHLIRDRIIGTKADPPSIQPVHVKTEFQLADIFTKPLRKTQIDFICNKLGMINIYAST
ncbi:hypothetical protein E3N88_24415 [Mikania micrantha]|uniref:Retrotransposon Copia-like N-terminal domain-containing protein n=1 Tax=Mikania micrantha TaxID=192012 RepID=A0A5N6N2D7_9ASTR|nr:hypothetical protein E3N88_24415 [Mikania micrantha]